MRHQVAALGVLALAVGCAGLTAPPPLPAPSWYAVTGGDVTALNLHETTAGLEGRVILGDGQAYVVRDVVRTPESLSFIVPWLEASFVATPSGEGWTGSWTKSGVATTLALQPGAAPADDAKHFVTLPDGRQIYLDCIGAGAPAVIFDAGAGGDHKVWRGVPEAVAKATTACTFDRAAHGLSDPGPLPRDAAAVANDIDEMLVAAKIPAPYVLVGHSLGSYHVRQYANTRLEKTAGLVLVDPSGDGQRALFAAAIPKMETLPGMGREPEKWAGCVTMLRASLTPKVQALVKGCLWNDADIVEAYFSEVDAMDQSSLQQLTASRRSYGALPMTVLTRGDYQKGMPLEFEDADREAMKRVWTDLHREMAALSTVGQNRVIPGTGHFIQNDAPQAVTDAILEVVAAARATKP